MIPQVQLLRRLLGSRVLILEDGGGTEAQHQVDSDQQDSGETHLELTLLRECSLVILLWTLETPSLWGSTMQVSHITSGTC